MVGVYHEACPLKMHTEGLKGPCHFRTFFNDVESFFLTGRNKRYQYCKKMGLIGKQSGLKASLDAWIDKVYSIFSIV